MDGDVEMIKQHSMYGKTQIPSAEGKSLELEQLRRLVH